MSTEFVAGLSPGDKVLRATRRLVPYGVYSPREEKGDEEWVVESVSPQRTRVVVRCAGNRHELRGQAVASLRPVDGEFESRYQGDTERLRAARAVADITGGSPAHEICAAACLSVADARELADAALAYLAVARKLGVLR